MMSCSETLAKMRDSCGRGWGARGEASRSGRTPPCARGFHAPCITRAGQAAGPASSACSPCQAHPCTTAPHLDGQLPAQRLLRHLQHGRQPAAARQQPHALAPRNVLQLHLRAQGRAGAGAACAHRDVNAQRRRQSAGGGARAQVEGGAGARRPQAHLHQGALEVERVAHLGGRGGGRSEGGRAGAGRSEARRAVPAGCPWALARGRVQWPPVPPASPSCGQCAGSSCRRGTPEKAGRECRGSAVGAQRERGGARWPQPQAKRHCRRPCTPAA